MDYKERYEMALEGIQEILSSGEDSIKMSRLQLRLQGIFPELRKVEDEEVRKAMIDFFKHEREEGIAVLHYGVNIERMIAWLEKKAEQKPTENKGMNLVEEEMTPFQRKVFCIIDATIEEEQGLKQVCDELLALASNEIKQKQWKPSYKQINALFELLPTTCSSNPVFALYKDLKKLKEE